MSVDGSGTAERGYVFDHSWAFESERLRANEAIWDAGTLERFDSIGVEAGWDCLELGAGIGSAAQWLAERVGPAGRVVALDLRAELLSQFPDRRFEVVEADIDTWNCSAESFDLIHARMVVQHLPDHLATISRLVELLKPGGTLFLEDTDSLPLFRSATSADFLDDVRTEGYAVMRSSGHEPRGGHFDLRALLSLGLADVGAEGRAVMVQGGTLRARHYILWLEFMREAIVARGHVGHDRIDAALEEMADPANWWMTQVLISCVGKKPDDRSS